jgi:hypothetical protein
VAKRIHDSQGILAQEFGPFRRFAEKGQQANAAEWLGVRDRLGPTVFTGYDAVEGSGEVLALMKDGTPADAAEADRTFRREENQADRTLRTSESAADRALRIGESEKDRALRIGEGQADRALRRQEGETDRAFRERQAEADRKFRTSESAADRETRKRPDALTAAEKAKIIIDARKAATNEYTQEFDQAAYDQIVSQIPGLRDQETQAPAPAASPPAPIAPKGAGTREDPYKPATTADFDALPSGAIYINPADGKPYRKN